jgi:hypothetical protein
MGSSTVLPTSLLLDHASWTIGGGAATKTAALNDGTDATYLSNLHLINNYIYFNMGVPTIPTGARITGVSIKYRALSNNGNTFVNVPVFQAFKKGTSIVANRTNLSQSYALDNAIHDVVGAPFSTTSGGTLIDDLDLTTVSIGIVDLAYPAAGGTQLLYSMSLVYTYNELPTVSGVAIDSVAKANPKVSWTYADPDGDVQQSYQCLIVDSLSTDSHGRAAGATNFDPTDQRSRHEQ